jgi:hypothetical protein
MTEVIALAEINKLYPLMRMRLSAARLCSVPTTFWLAHDIAVPLGYVLYPRHFG